MKSCDNNADALSMLTLPCKHKEVIDETSWVGIYLHCLNERSFPVTSKDIKEETQLDTSLKKSMV